MAYPKFQEKLQVCKDLLHGFDFSGFVGGSPLTMAKLITGGVNFILDASVPERKDLFLKEAMLLKQSHSLCSSMTTEQERHEAAYMEALRSTIIKITYGGTGGKSLSLTEINDQINELLKAAVQSEGVISLFDSSKSGGENFSLFDPAVLDEISRMKEKNIAVEILKKLMAEQVALYKRTNVVQSQKFSEKIAQLMNSYYNGLITNEEVIKELLKTAEEIANLYKNGQKLGLSQEELELCISYVLRRAVCEIPTNSMNKTFATLKNYIKPDDYLNSVKAFFVMQDTYKEFPDNDKFEGAFVNRDIYNMRARNYILSRLENFENKAPITIENYTIEHIMPQNKNLSLEWQTNLGPEWQEVQKKYLHTIGNLTLTAYNSEMSDRPFLDKMDMLGGFKESALRINKYVVLQNEWNETHIQERANELAKKAEVIWPYPALTATELAPYQAEEKTVQKYSLESYAVNAFTRMLFESLDKRIMKLSPRVKKEYKKLYVAYKLDTNFVDIVFQKQRLRISINMKFSELNDPNGICKDISGLGRWGNGDVELFMEHQDELEQIMEIVKQSYDAQAEGGIDCGLAINIL